MVRVNSAVALKPEMVERAIGFYPSEMFTIEDIYDGACGKLCTIENKHRCIVNVPLIYWQEISPEKN
jgi:hypothetical protein